MRVRSSRRFESGGRAILVAILSSVKSKSGPSVDVMVDKI